MDKVCKDSVAVWHNSSNASAEPTLISQHIGLVERCKKMATAAVKCGSLEHMRKTVELVTRQTEMLESLSTNHEPTTTDNDPRGECSLRNPPQVRTKGCGTSNSAQNKCSQIVRKARTCSVCGETGNNRKSCHVQKGIDLMKQSQVMSNDVEEEDDYDNDETDFDTIDINVG